MEKLNRAKAIRLKCLDCSGESFLEVRECTVKSCALYQFRMGKVPRDIKTQEEKVN